MAISPQRLTIYLYSAHRAVIFAIAQLSCYYLSVVGIDDCHCHYYADCLCDICLVDIIKWIVFRHTRCEYI